MLVLNHLFGLLVWQLFELFAEVFALITDFKNEILLADLDVNVPKILLNTSSLAQFWLLQLIDVSCDLNGIETCSS